MNPIIRNIFKSPVYYALFILLASSQATHAQTIEEFPEDSAGFIETLSEYLKGRISESNEAVVEKFTEYWKESKFTLQKRDSIIKISNLMLKYGANREPQFTTMLDFMIRINNTRFESDYFDTWMKGFHHLIGEPKRRLSKIINYFHFTLDFIESESLYSSRSRSWYAQSNDYRFLYDTTIKIIYTQTHLTCKHREDSIRIYETGGTYYPFQRMWYGNGGKITWERAGYAPDQVYAKLNGYKIDMSKAEYQADSATFINKLYFDHPIPGRVNDQLIHIIRPSDAIYPVFNSYQKIFEIPGIYDNMDYTGGFQMKGADFIGKGGNGRDAKLKVHRNGKVFMTASAKNFLLTKNKALSSKASIIIHLKQDSIFHTGLQFSYYVNDEELELTSNDNILSKSVYYNTYHKVSMKFDRLLWNTNEDKIHLTHSRNSSMGQATFTSMNYYTLDEWLKLEMRDRKHPLIAIRNYHNKTGSQVFDAGEYAKYIKLPTYQVRQRLMYLAQDGFIFYNIESDTVTINNKLFDYIQARIGKRDYDVIRINSSTKAPAHNATLNLSNLDLNIKGVNRIFVSDSQNVVIYPDQRGITMKKNRQFDFGGTIVGGLLTFFGDSMSFDYEKFNIAMDKVDSVRLRYKTDQVNAYGQKMLASVQNTINDLTGVLHIDNPDNKSGKENFPRYPIFKGKQKSYVYYDDLFNGPYKKENFYFELYPFTIDSLDNFKPENMAFKGNFYSAGIFPPFEETLVIREDNSLGFQKTTSQEGLPLYDGKGQYYRQIDMSNKGLKGRGKMTYLTSTAVTDDILFFPDSTSIHASEFNIDQKTTGIEFPDVASKAVNIKWYPHENDMYINKTDKRFTMYNGKSSLDGKLNLKPTGLTGSGLMDMKKATLESQRLTFQSQAFNADEADFVLRTSGGNDVAFKSEQLDGHVNYDYQTARFNTINNYSISEFPQNLYVGYLDEFVWQMEKDLLEVESTPEPKTLGNTSELNRLKDGDLRGALYMSTHKSHDSLRFTSREMTFDASGTTMRAKNVEYLFSADAKIFPDEGNLTIRSQANMDTLRDVKLVANRNSKFHNIFNADIKVQGRKDYGGNGDYNYTDMNDSVQTIHFNNIGVDDSVQTYAIGAIEKTDNFKLSPYFDYAGHVKLKANRKLLNFDGGARMAHHCKEIFPRYVSFESVIDPDSIYIPIKGQKTDIKGNKVFAGSYVTLDSSHVYSTFMTPRKDPSDDLIISSRGFLNYNENSGQYRIASALKHQNPGTTGPMINLSKDSCLYQAEGNMNLGVDLKQITLAPAGQLKHKLAENEVTLDLTLPVKFHFSSAALDTMAGDISSRTNLEHANTTSSFYTGNLEEIVGHETTQKYLDMINTGDTLSPNGKTSVPAGLQHTIIFSDLHFDWHTSTSSYVAQGDINIATINGVAINKKVEGFIEIIKQTGNDRLYIHLKPDNDRYYLFYYARGMMRTYSNNPKFVKAIEEVPSRKRELGGGLFSTPTYRYILATSTIRSRVQRHIEEVKETIRLERQNKKAEKPTEAKNQTNQNESEVTEEPSQDEKNGEGS